MVEGREVIRQHGEVSTESRTVLICFFLELRRSVFCQGQGAGEQGRAQRRNNQGNKRRCPHWVRRVGAWDDMTLGPEPEQMQNDGCEQLHFMVWGREDERFIYVWPFFFFPTEVSDDIG